MAPDPGHGKGHGKTPGRSPGSSIAECPFAYLTMIEPFMSVWTSHLKK
jgi:hypothetical protein